MKTNRQRRTILKSAAIGGGIIGASSTAPEKWLKPVVDSVMLPAHASTTDDTGILPGEVGSRYSFIDPNFNFSENSLGIKRPLAMATPQGKGTTLANQKLANRLLEMIMPSAYAAPSSSLATLELFLEITAEGVYRFVFLLIASENGGEGRLVWFTNSVVALGDNNATLDFCVDDGGSPQDVVITVNSVTPTLVSINLGSESFELLYDQNAVAPQKVACIIPE